MAVAGGGGGAAGAICTGAGAGVRLGFGGFLAAANTGTVVGVGAEALA